jgi:membrane-bound serine protease (ClpP class)
MGVRAMIGQRATARSYLDPEGFVFIKGERWKAVAEDGPVFEGDPVEVVDVKGLTLLVRRHPSPQPQAQPQP